MSALYEVTLFDGDANAGDQTIEADNMQDAIAQATEWAKNGDWDHPGSVEIRIVGPDEETTERVSISVGEEE